jgi:uncharacterized protein (DUF433 family)
MSSELSLRFPDEARVEVTFDDVEAGRLPRYGEGFLKTTMRSRRWFMEPWIITRPGVLGGKPCIRGTRISVEFVLELLASGATRDDILRAYAHIPPEGLSAALQYAARSLRNEVIWDVQIPA